MSSGSPIRILSDLHVGHPASLVKDVRQIAPLVEGMTKIVFNGDTVELRLTRLRSRGLQALKELRQLCQIHEAEAVFLNGNHDPDVSSRNHLDLMGGRVFVTHGHALFPAITPWGRDADRLREHHRLALEELVGDRDPTLEERLEAVTRAVLRVPPKEGRSPQTALEWTAAALSELAHPLRTFEVLRAWFTAPRLGHALVSRHRPLAQCVVTGHTHFPGSWRREDKFFMNTGAFLPGFGRRLIDLAHDEVVMRQIEWTGTHFRPGREIGRWTIGATEIDPTGARQAGATNW